MNGNLKTAWRLSFKYTFKAVKETFITLRQVIRAKRYLAKSNTKRYNRERFEEYFSEVYDA